MPTPQLLNWLRQPDPPRPADDGDAAAAYNADPAHYRPVEADAVAAWMGASARFARLKTFAETPSEDPQIIALQSAIGTVLAFANNSRARIDLHPGHDQRDMLDGLVAAEVIEPEEAALLVAAALPEGWIDATAQDVADARDRIARETETADAATAAQQAMERVAAWRNRYQAEGDCPPPPTLSVEAPEGFEFDVETTQLVPVEVE